MAPGPRSGQALGLQRALAADGSTRGGEGEAARKARDMAQRIADATGRPVELWDERLTTVEAKRALAASRVRGRKARGRIDEAAACAILQSWLEAARIARE
jgi:putative Holliday junction resolvase